MPKILHFADAHIDMANYGRHDPESGLPLRVLDFLNSLDQIIDAAINEHVDLVIFAGDAYKDRSPAPTFQREWGKRIMRLAHKKIPTLLLVGNHDLSPALGRAHALETFNTFEVPYVNVLDKPQFIGPEDLHGLPLQVIALPWVSRSGMMAYLDIRASSPGEVYDVLGAKITELVQGWLQKASTEYPIILTAHASVQGAKFGGERTVMLGNDLVLDGSLVRNPQLDYVALGHIHKPQDLNEGNHPPVIYPGSIERVDFGEANEQKYYVIADIKPGKTSVQWCELKNTRPFIDRYIRLEERDNINHQIKAILPSQEKLDGAIFRLTLAYPREWEAIIDEAYLRDYTASAFEFHLVKRPEMDTRIRLPEDQTVGSLSPLELLNLYWKSTHTEPADRKRLSSLAADLLSQVYEPPEDAGG